MFCESSLAIWRSPASLAPFAGRALGLCSRPIDDGPWNGDRQEHRVRDERERKIETDPMGALELDVPDGAREDLVLGFVLGESPGRGAPAEPGDQQGGSGRPLCPLSGCL